MNYQWGISQYISEWVVVNQEWPECFIIVCREKAKGSKGSLKWPQFVAHF